MKALISPNEILDITYIASWDDDEPVYETIENCQRVAEVEPDDKVFEVAQPLHWIDAPDDCIADEWYYKDGLYKKPIDAIKD
jgi:hypothetical protein